MARKIVKEEAVTEKKTTRKSKISELSVLVSRWGENKSTADKLKKEVDKDAAQIKQIMIDKKMENSTSGVYTADLSFRDDTTIDEDGVMNFIKTKLWGNKGSMECPYIKRIEVIDWDALEKAIYNGEITKKQVLAMDKFKTVKKTPVLKLKVQKEG